MKEVNFTMGQEDADKFLDILLARFDKLEDNMHKFVEKTNDGTTEMIVKQTKLEEGIKTNDIQTKTNRSDIERMNNKINVWTGGITVILVVGGGLFALLRTQL